MSTFNTSGNITSLSLERIRRFNPFSCKELIESIGKVVNKNLSASCDVKSVIHNYEIRADIKNKISKVMLSQKECPGTTLQYKDEPKHIGGFTYEELKKAAQREGERYVGILYGSIENLTCDTTITCPSCNGSGICSTCNGDKQVVCPVCDGTKECVSCNGTGRFTCTNCEGDGVCPECDDGWITCGECGGNGTIDCPDCNGSGNYIDAECRSCGGTGDYHGSECRTCGGSGRFILECRCCDGSGTVECDECDGDGGWNCDECHGSGKCSHCHGEGNFECKACHGTGKCGKCRGKGKIWCPDCHGKGICFECKGEKIVVCPRCNGSGWYQSYTEYSLTDSEVSKELCSFPLSKEQLSLIDGDVCFEDAIYEFFAKKACLYDPNSIIEAVGGYCVDTLKSWIALENNAPFNPDDVSDDYLSTFVKLQMIPVTKVVLGCNSKDYTFWIVGNNRVVFFEKLPKVHTVLWSRLNKLFRKK